MQDRVCRLRRLRLASGVPVAPVAIELAAVPRKYLADPDAVGASLYARLDALGAKPVRAPPRASAASLGEGDACDFVAEPNLGHA